MVWDWMKNTHRPRILHVFDRACNLLNERGEVLSIVTSKMGNGPFNLVVDDHVLFTEYIQSESPVAIFDRQLIVGDLTFDTEGAKVWDPNPGWGTLYGNRDMIADLLAAYPDPKSQLPTSLYLDLISALVDGDVAASEAATCRLAGLGVGLTPAGDDWIMGALFAVWMIHPPAKAKLLARDVTDTAAPLTTSLSAAWLRSAGRGEPGEMWLVLFDELRCSHPAQIQSALENILSFGATSGAEALAGFLATIHFYTERRKKHVLLGSI
jgi:hypothetical protein